MLNMPKSATGRLSDSCVLLFAVSATRFKKYLELWSIRNASAVGTRVSADQLADWRWSVELSWSSWVSEKTRIRAWRRRRPSTTRRSGCPASRGWAVATASTTTTTKDTVSWLDLSVHCHPEQYLHGAGTLTVSCRQSLELWFTVVYISSVFGVRLTWWRIRVIILSKLFMHISTIIAIIIVMSCMRVCRKQALSRVKYYYYVINSKIQQQQ